MLKRDADARRILLAQGVRLCPTCGKVRENCTEHADPAPAPKRYSLSKVADPKSGFYPGSTPHQEWKRGKRVEMQRNPTDAERVLLTHLDALLWEFQADRLGYVPDFAHNLLKIIIEVDGTVHNTTAGKRRDARRDNIFRLNGYSVLRFSNAQVIYCTPDVLAVIHAYVRARLGGKRQNP